MTLTDTGPLIALLDKHDPNHLRALATARTLPSGPLITTLPCFTETMYFLFNEGGHSAQQRLWDMRSKNKLLVHIMSDTDLDRMEALMLQYKDLPMDLADASLVVAAETLNLDRVFTLDSHFRAYRLIGAKAFIVSP